MASFTHIMILIGKKSLNFFLRYTIKTIELGKFLF